MVINYHIFYIYLTVIAMLHNLENTMNKKMSYKTRMKCDVRHIIPCGLCPQMLNCPYDKEDERVVFTKEHAEND